MSSALSKINTYRIYLQGILSFISIIILSTNLHSQELPLHSRENFYNYLLRKFQNKETDSNIHRKIWNYLSNPNKGYRGAGLTSYEFGNIVREYILTSYSKEILKNIAEAMNIDTFEVYTGEDKTDKILEYIEHIKRVSQNLGLELTNINNKFLIVSLEGEQPPLGLVGRIRISNNYIEQRQQISSDREIKFLSSSKLAIEAAMFAMGILKEINLKPLNRIILIIDLSLIKTPDPADLFNSYEIPPVNLILDSVFPVLSAEYGYAIIKLNQSIKEETMKKSCIKKIIANGGDFQKPDTAILYLDPQRIDKNSISDRLVRFSVKNNNIAIQSGEDGDLYIKFESLSDRKGSMPDALDYLVSFLSENRDLYPESVRLFEYLRRNIVLNPSGKSLGINRSHPLLNHTEVILKSIRLNGSSIGAEIYIRFPYGIDSFVLVDKIKNNVNLFNKKETADIEVYVNAYNPVTIDTNSDIAIKLKKAYEQTTGDFQKPQVYDGYYTKIFPNSIGFGPLFPSYTKQSIADGTFIGESEIIKLVNIYTTAFISLMER